MVWESGPKLVIARDEQVKNDGEVETGVDCILRIGMAKCHFRT